MAAGGGAVVSMAFSPREMGREEDEYIVTGDSTGSVGVYHVQTGECQSTFGIPGPPGIPDMDVTSVQCLNASGAQTGDDGISSLCEHSPLILAGAYDGRVAVFRSDLLSKKYSVLSAFQASGRSLWSDLRKPETLVASTNASCGQGNPVGFSKRYKGGAPEQFSADATRFESLVRRSGNGLVLNFCSSQSKLYAAGCEVNVLRAWDLEREVCSWEGKVVRKGVWPTAISTSQMAGNDIVIVGGSDGSVSIVDTRAPTLRSEVGGLAPSSDALVSSGMRVLGSHDQPIVSVQQCSWQGAGCGHTIITADCRGRMYWWDPRVGGAAAADRLPYRGVVAHGASLTAMASHPSGHIVASGSTAKCVKVFGSDFEPKVAIRHRSSSSSAHQLSERIAPVTSLAFQQDAYTLAVGCSDSSVIIYGNNLL